MRYQFLPPLTDDEILALQEDISQNGMLHPIIVDEKGQILDGHHRAAIAKQLGFKPDRHVMEGLTEVEKRTLAFRLNTGRRHMDREQRRGVVIASLKADPQLSDRQHARRTGVSHPTVASIRAELEGSGRLESFTSRTSADGRTRPATQPVDVGKFPTSTTDHPASRGEEAAGQPASPGPATGPREAEGVSQSPPSAAANPTEVPGDTSVDAAGQRDEARQPEGPAAAGAPATFPDAGAPVSPLDDPAEIERQHRIRSSESVAKALATLLLRLDPDPIGWLETTWIRDAFRERDLPRVRDAFTADGLRLIAKHIESIADRVDRDGGVL
jgi:hypothetical protein